MWRICHALDEHPYELARNCGVPTSDITDLLSGGRSELAEIDRYDVWDKIEQHISRKAGMLMAVRYEMKRKLQQDRTARADRMERFRKVTGD